MQNLPNPNDFEDWRAWASVMQVQVEQELLRLASQKAKVDLITEQAGKPRSGYPVGEPGALVGVLGDSNNPVLLKVFINGTWKSL